MALKTYVVDLKVEMRRKMKGGLSDFLVQKMKETLEKNEQVLLFLNKRGYSSSIICVACGNTPTCKHCEISMTYHKTGKDYLLCHYCGLKQFITDSCSACKTPHSIVHVGTGTQKIEEELFALFPGRNIKRVDLDSMNKKKAYDELLSDMNEQKIDILIGTQIIAKGFDFPHVTLVGIVNADVGLTIPDFRAHERTFSLITQVVGRASRKGQDGCVVVQTMLPSHPAIAYALTNDYDGYYEYEIELRKKFHYPPFTEIVKCTFAHKSEEKAEEMVAKKAEELEETAKTLGNSCHILTAPSYIAKQQGKYFFHILVIGKNPHELIEKTKFETAWKIDVDPMVTV